MKRIIKFSCFICLIVGIFLLFITNQSMATTYCVSNEANLIAALNEAKDNGANDIIKIQQGTYYGNFVYASTESFGVTVEGGYTALCTGRVVDPDNTVLDGQENGAVLVLSAPDVAADFVVEGITLQNGDYQKGGGLHVRSRWGDLTLNNNTISNNSGIGLWFSSDSHGKVILDNNTISNNSGSGLYAEQGADEITLRNNTISNNSGHGVYLWASTLNLNNNTISANSQKGILIKGTSWATLKENIINNNHSGGIESVTGANWTLTSNTITNNDGNGGVYFRHPSNVTLTNNTINNNSSESLGGGVSLPDVQDTVTLVNNTINNNISNSGSGGGVSIVRGDPIKFTMTNNIISNNSASGGGGGVNLDVFVWGSIDLTNNTINNNSTSQNGGGIRLFFELNDKIANIYNNIIWNNNAVGSGADIYINNDGNNDYLPSTVNLFNNDFDQSANGTYIKIPFPIDPSNLNNADPLFVDPDNGDFHLTENSPCKDAGRDAGVYVDIDGDSRPQGSGFDIGADEILVDEVLVYTPVTPCRISDTRKAGGAISAGGIRSYNVWGAIASQGGNPAGCLSPKGEPRAVHVNVTSVPMGNGWITAYPYGSTAPTASLVNYRSDAQNVANSGTIKICSNCAKDINIKSGGGKTHVIIDVLGYYYSAP